MKNTQPLNFLLWPEHTADQKSIDYWADDLLENDMVLSVVRSDAFLRLEHISFLGALDYTCPTKGIEKHERSRAEHSLYVAAIANYVSHRREYPTELKNHLIVAALLHDIGHPPLSHSAEPFIKKEIGYGHHEAGEQIITGKNALGHSLFKTLQSYCDVDFILALINGEVDSAYGGDLFNSAINIDTIDGILRSHRYITGIRPSLTHLAIADASFFDRESNEHFILDEFWSMKERVYSGLINNDLGLLSDKTSEHFFSHSGISFEEADMYTCEKTWKKKHKGLFQELGNILKKTSIPEWLLDEEFSFTKRQYVIDRNKDNENRYKCIKQVKHHSFKEAKAMDFTSNKLLI